MIAPEFKENLVFVVLWWRKRHANTPESKKLVNFVVRYRKRIIMLIRRE